VEAVTDPFDELVAVALLTGRVFVLTGTVFVLGTFPTACPCFWSASELEGLLSFKIFCKNITYRFLHFSTTACFSFSEFHTEWVSESSISLLHLERVKFGSPIMNW
jgi:hypothetical protein